MTSKDYIYNELLEHTLDADYAKAQHFYEYNKYRKLDRVFDVLEVVFLLSLITIYMVVFEVKDLQFVRILAVVVSIVATIVEILKYILNFSSLSNEHWKAAQMYSALYRECQFFCANYLSFSEDVWREKLSSICQELNRLAIMSPGLSSKSYKKVEGSLRHKNYPVHAIIEENKLNPLNNVFDSIKKALAEFDIEIYLYGSYLSSMVYGDIDIAVFVHKDTGIDFTDIANSIESEYLAKEMNLDITIITESDIVAHRFTTLVRNINKNGKCYYKSSRIKECLKDYEIDAITNYPEMINYFIEEADKAYAEKQDKYFVTCVFYAYYHTLSSFLSENNVIWFSEDSLIDSAEKLSYNNDDLSVIVAGIRKVNKLKQQIFLETMPTGVKNIDEIYNQFLEAKTNPIILRYLNQMKLQSGKELCEING